jgi:hypothetical protein
MVWKLNSSEATQRDPLEKLLGKLFGRPYLAPEFCRENFALRV